MALRARYQTINPHLSPFFIVSRSTSSVARPPSQPAMVGHNASGWLGSTNTGQPKPYSHRCCGRVRSPMVASSRSPVTLPKEPTTHRRSLRPRTPQRGCRGLRTKGCRGWDWQLKVDCKMTPPPMTYKRLFFFSEAAAWDGTSGHCMHIEKLRLPWWTGQTSKSAESAVRPRMVVSRVGFSDSYCNTPN